MVGSTPAVFPFKTSFFGLSWWSSGYDFTFQCRGTSSIPGREIKIPHATCHGQKTKQLPQKTLPSPNPGPSPPQGKTLASISTVWSPRLSYITSVIRHPGLILVSIPHQKPVSLFPASCVPPILDGSCVKNRWTHL